MAALRQSDAELVETFLSQADRDTHSGLKLSDCFSPTAFDFVFHYGTVLQKSAVRQALLACNSLPVVDPRFATPVHNLTFEKHLNNLLLHILRVIADNNDVSSSDRHIAKLLVDVASLEPQKIRSRDADDRRPVTDNEATSEIEQAMKKALDIRD